MATAGRAALRRERQDRALGPRREVLKRHGRLPRRPGCALLVVESTSVLLPHAINVHVHWDFNDGSESQAVAPKCFRGREALSLRISSFKFGLAEGGHVGCSI